MIVAVPGHTILLFDVSAVDSVKQKLSGKESFVMSQLPCLASSSPFCRGDCGSSWPYSLTFLTNIFYTVLESGAARTTELSLMMSSVICRSSKRKPDYESDTEMNV